MSHIGNNHKSLACQGEQEALRKGYERITRLLESIGDGFVSLDGDWHFTYVNAKAETLLARKREELLGRTLWETFPEVTGTPFEDFFRRAMEGPVDLLESFYPPLGRWFEVRADSHPEGLSLHFQDITGRKQTEEALRQSEERFRTLVDQAGDAFFLHDPRGTLLDVNRQACESLGYPREELLRLDVGDIEALHAHVGLQETWRQIPPGGVATIHGEHRRKDGSTFPVEVRVAKVESEGRIVISALARDMTDRRRAEDSLRQALAEARGARDRTDVILRSVADGLLVTDLEERVILMNPAAERMLGLPQADVLYRPLREIFPGEEAAVQIVALGEEQGNRVLEARTSTIREGKEPVGLITLLRDITREREIDRLKSEIMSTAAHELRTPLASIMGFSELLLMPHEFDADQQQEFLTYIHQKSEDLSAIIDDLLNLSRIESGRPICLNLTEFDLKGAVAGTVEQYRQEFPDRLFHLRLPENPLRVCMDRGKFGQVLNNLLSNAVKYSPSSETVEISVEAAQEGIQLKVSDQGIGMTAEQAARAFEKFYRVDSSNTARHGMGLGLSIVRSIVEAHKGSARIESAPGKGTHLIVTFPLETVVLGPAIPPPAPC